jgi:hypothetical protein
MMNPGPPLWAILAGGVAGFLFFCVLLGVAIVELRNRHPAEVYTLWYVFSLTLCISFVGFLAFPNLAPLNKLVPDADLGVVGQWASFVLRTATDIGGEAKLITFVFVVLVLPQIISFLLGGLSGCGWRPQLSPHFFEGQNTTRGWRFATTSLV